MSDHNRNHDDDALKGRDNSLSKSSREDDPTKNDEAGNDVQGKVEDRSLDDDGEKKLGEALEKGRRKKKEEEDRKLKEKSRVKVRNTCYRVICTKYFSAGS